MDKEIGVAPQVQRPAPIAADTIAFAFPALAVTFQVSMFNLDARASRFIAERWHLDTSLAERRFRTVAGQEPRAAER